MTLRSFDHLIFVVHDLEAGAEAFRRLGFAITERADKEIGATENQLVVLADGSYVEIVRFTDPAILPQHRFKALAHSGGWAEAVIGVDDLEAIHAQLAQAGVPTSPVRRVRKELDDGQAWEVVLSHFGRGVGSPLMPMLAQDLTPHHLRVPDHKTAHPNGATAISAVTMVAAGPAPAGYGVLFGTAEGNEFGFANGRRVIHRQKQGHEDHLEKRGEGILSVTISRGAGQPPLTLTADAVIGA